jgi:Flp pilus assembly protein TadD
VSAQPLLRAALAVAVWLAGAGCSHLVILRDPLTAAEHNDLGVAYEKSGDRRLAERQYRRALRKDGRLARARVNLGNLRAAESRWAAAEREYRRALGVQAGDPDALNNLAYALLRRGRRLSEAEALAVAAVRASGARDSIYRVTLEEIRIARSRAPTDP